MKKICKVCKEFKEHYAKGMCRPCYRKKRRRENPIKIICKECKEFREHQAKGLCSKCYIRKWVKKNPEKRKENSKKYYGKNKDWIKMKAKRWVEKNYEKHKLRHNKINKKWRIKNADKVREINRNWTRKNPDKIREYHYKRRINGFIKKGMINRIVNENILKYGIITCEKCKRDCEENYHIDHIIPINKSGDNNYNNLQILCQHCNCSKHTDIADYRQDVGSNQLYLK